MNNVKEKHWLKEHWLILLTGVVVGIATLVLTAAGNPKNMGFCLAFLVNIIGI